MVVVGIAIYVMFSRRPVPTSETPAPAATAAAPEPTRPLGGEPEAVTVPPLDQSDAVVRKLVSALSNHPAVASWLTTNGLIRSFTVAVGNIAEGVAPAKPLSALRPRQPFAVVEAGGRSHIDPKSYDRYNRLADGVASVDPAGAARLYATLKPRIEESFGELGLPDRRFDQVLEQAIVSLLRTPTPDGPIEVKPAGKGIDYAYADQRFERLSEPQKSLLRMGPRNVKIIKTKLREIALALGIPPARLPSE